MATFTKQLASGSTSGKAVEITGTSSGSGQTVHTADSDAGDIDEVTLYATNIGTVAETLTVEWGATNSANEIKIDIEPQSGLTLIASGLLISGGLVVSAYASTASKIMIYASVINIDA